MLTAYQTQTQTLLTYPSAPQNLYATTDINRWINIARGQTAGQGECIRRFGTINTVVGQRNYNFKDIAFSPVDPSVQGVIHIRSIMLVLGATGFQMLYPRAWEWFQQFHLANPFPDNGQPQLWAQFGQGSAGTSTGSGSSGSFYIDPPPDNIYTLQCDCVCYPIALVDDSTVEAIPYLWTDAVPFFAAYYALLSAQTGARQNDANRLFTAWGQFMTYARNAANPKMTQGIYQGNPDPSMPSKFGMKAGGG